MAVKYLRFADLKARGLVNSRPSLRYRIRKFKFPLGRLIGPNTRAWTEGEVEAWIASQPTALKAAPRRLAASKTAAPRRRRHSRETETVTAKI